MRVPTPRRGRTADHLASLGSRLDDLYRDFNQADAIADPVNLVRRFTAPADREVAGFCAAALAFGRVASVNQSIETRVRVDGAVARGLRPSVRAADATGGHSPPSCTAGRAGPTSSRCCGCCGRCSIGPDRSKRFFAEGDDPSAADIGPALDSFSERALALDLRGAYGRVPKRPGVCYFFPRPAAGSACKRLNLFLRWMVRRDAVDLGVWTACHAVAAGRAARHARDPTGPVPAADALPLGRVAHGGRHHRVAARHRPGRPRSLRLLDLPRRHDGQLRVQDEAGGQPVPIERDLPAAAGGDSEMHNAQRLEAAANVSCQRSAVNGQRSTVDELTSDSVAARCPPARFRRRPACRRHHPIDREPLADARQSGCAHPGAKRLVAAAAS